MNRFSKAFREARTRLKAAGGMLFSGSGGGGWFSWSRPWRWATSRYDYTKEVGDGTGNSAVQACLLWVARTFPEAPIRVLDADGEEVERHALTALIRRPNPFYSGPLLWMATVTDFNGTGNAYWRKVRSGAGRVVELWYTPSWMIRPAWPQDGSVFISHYEYTVNGKVQEIPTADVVHFRFGLDPLTRCGISPLASLLEEIFTDNEAARFVAALLRNLGIPGVVISPDGDGSMSADEADAVKETFMRKFGADKRGEPMVMEGNTKVQIMSFSPQQMDLKALRRIPEERVSAVLGVPAIVAGLGAGLDRSTYNNMAEAREQAYESNIIPTQRLLTAEMDSQLLADFDGANATTRTDFDLSQVRVLSDDQDRLYARLDRGFKGGWLSMAEVRKSAGWDVAPEHENRYLKPAAGSYVTLEEIANSPEPPPTPTITEVPPPQLTEGGKGFKAASGGDTALSSADVEDLFAGRLAALGLPEPKGGNGRR